MWLSHHSPHEPRHNRLPLEALSGFPALTHACRSLRSEYYSLFLEQVKVQVDLQYVAPYAAYFDRNMKHCRSHVNVVCFPPDDPESPVDLLPILSLATDVVNLEIIIDCRESQYAGCYVWEDMCCADSLSELEAQDMSTLVGLCRTNATWQKYVREPIQSVLLHQPRNRCPHDNERDDPTPLDAWLQITFTKEHEQLWMTGTHSFPELQAFLSETGLDGMKAMDVRVGLTTMKNKGRGRGLRTKEEQHEINWLLGRSTKPPKGIKRRPRMLRELD